MRFIIVALAAMTLVSCGEQARQQNLLVKFDAVSAEAALKIFPDLLAVKDQSGSEEWLLETQESSLYELSAWMHEFAGRCGGFFAATSEEQFEDNTWAAALEPTYVMDQEELVSDLIPLVLASNIRATIEHLSTYHNRFYQAGTGVSSQQWLYSLWQTYGVGVEGFEVELVSHPDWPQPSVVATWQGAVYPEEVVVIGGHGDSISGSFGQIGNRAPGADDNASGVASISEVVRVLTAANFRPARTIKFMSYAAEEVGLRGSQEIARDHRRDEAQVIGVMQLDMTNFAGSGRNTLSFTRDFTSDALTEFTVSLFRNYLRGTVLNHRCGYACSDHASWHRQGYPTVYPFEAQGSQRNRRIHTPADTLSNSDSTAQHSEMFARLALAFAIELAKDSQ